MKHIFRGQKKNVRVVFFLQNKRALVQTFSCFGEVPGPFWEPPGPFWEPPGLFFIDFPCFSEKHAANAIRIGEIWKRPGYRAVRSRKSRVKTTIAAGATYTWRKD